MQFDAQSALENLLATDFEVQYPGGNFDRPTLKEVTLVGQPPELDTIIVHPEKSTEVKDIGLVSSIHAIYKTYLNFNTIYPGPSVFPRSSFVVVYDTEIHCLYDPLPQGISYEEKRTNDSLPFQRVSKHPELQNIDTPGIYLVKFYAPGMIRLFLDASVADLDNFLDRFPQYDVVRYFNRYVIRDFRGPIEIIVGPSFEDYLQNHCLLNIDLCYWELSKPYYMMDSEVAHNYLYLLDQAFFARSRLYEAVAQYTLYEGFEFRYSMLRDMKMYRLLFEHREYNEFLKWNELISQLKEEQKDWPMFFLQKHPHDPAIESNIYVFPYYGPTPASIYKYPWNPHLTDHFMQLSQFAVENNETETADGLDYSTFFANMLDPQEGAQRGRRETEMAAILIHPFGRWPNMEMYRPSSPQRKRVKR